MPIRATAVVTSLILCAIQAPAAFAADRPMNERISQGEDGHPVIEPIQQAGALANPWPAQWEQEFQARRAASIAAFKGKSSNRTQDEGEKWGLPASIGAYFAGDHDAALAAMQAQDRQAQVDHAHTNGIDLYWCFTLKGQVRKWFEFQHLFSEQYQEQFKQGMTTWSASDPRPSLEYVNVLQDAEGALRDFVLAELQKMYRDEAALLAMADAAEAEGHPNKKRFATFIRANAAKIAGTLPGDDPAKWMTWWQSITAGGWMVFEEYERRTNPNPHPKYGIGKGPVGAAWNPSIRGMRADARNTDNLRGMREVAVYLFAEASGNDVIRELYKARLKRTAFGFWEVGNGEWDSEGYLGHTMSAYINLYDFAKDPEVRAWGKAIMDFLFVSAAVKYRRGAWGGPLVRDYGNRSPWSTSAHTSWYYYGEADAPHHEELELALFFSSSYQPPAAAVALAKKQIPAGTELFASHPHYENFLPGNDVKPVYHETSYFGDTFQLGTMIEGHGYNRNGFKLLVDNPAGLVDYIIPTTGKPKNPATSTAGGDVILQNKHTALYINRKGNVPFHVLVPAQAAMEGGPLNSKVLTVHNTWVALFPVNLKWGNEVALKKKGKSNKSNKAGQKLLAGTGDGVYFVVGDKASYKDKAAFLAALASVTISADGKAIAASTGDLSLALSAEGQLSRDDAPINKAERQDLWQPGPGSEAVLQLGWKERVMQISAGGHTYKAQLHEDGRYEFSTTLAP